MLGVDDGEWKAVEPSGGVITIYLDDQGDGYLVDARNDGTSYSWNRLSALASEGKSFVLYISGSDAELYEMSEGYRFLTSLTYVGGFYTASFGTQSLDNMKFIALINTDGLIFEDNY